MQPMRQPLHLPNSHPFRSISLATQQRILDALIQEVPENAEIVDVSVGIFWTFVQTQYGSAISASAHRWCEDPPGAIIPFAGNLIGMRVRDVYPLYNSESLTARSLANAAVSAAFDSHHMTGRCIPGRGQEIIASICGQNTPKLRIALVGHFHFADELKAFGHHLDIFELEGRCEPGDLPNTRMPEFLPLADVVVMTSSTIITHATEAILKLARPDAKKLIIGPTVPIHPILWDYGLDVICGSIITDPKQVAIAARQGGNHKQFSGCTKINYIRPGLEN